MKTQLSNIVSAINAEDERISLEYHKLKEGFKSFKSDKIDELAEYYISTEDKVHLPTMMELFDFPEILKLLEKISYKREIESEEFFNPHLLYFLESRNSEHEEVREPLRAIFDKFSEPNKLRLATICMGYKNLAKIYPFLLLWLESELIAMEPIGPEQVNLHGNALKLEGYDPRTNSATFSLRIVKGKSLGLKEVSDAIMKLIRLDYKYPFINLETSSLDDFDNRKRICFDGIIRAENLEVIHEGRGETLHDKINSCIDYAATNLWYYSNS